MKCEQIFSPTCMAYAIRHYRFMSSTSIVSFIHDTVAFQVKKTPPTFYLLTFGHFTQIRILCTFSLCINKITNNKYGLRLNSGNLDSSYHTYFLQTGLYQCVIQRYLVYKPLLLQKLSSHCF